MPYAEREYLCAGCGRLIRVRASAAAKPRCVQCGIARGAAVMMQIHQRNGPEYEKWLLASIESLQRRLIAYRNRAAYDDPIQALRGK